MVVLWQKKRMVFLLGILSGILVSIGFVRPYQDEVTLTYVVLQLSGARGDFAMGSSLTELVGFMLRMVPNMLVIMVMGSQLYQHFCTASIYVFSRCPSRLAWYGKSLVPLFTHLFLFEGTFVAAAVLAALPKCRITVSAGDVRLLGFHVVIYLLWLFGWVVLTNLIAIKLGSSPAFITVMTVQALCTAALALVNFLERRQMQADIIEWLLCCNPVAHTVLSWHQGAPFEKELAGSRYALNPIISLALFFLLDIVIVWAGGILIQRQDLLSENLETEEG